MNASPSLTANTRDDYNLKLAMLTSVLDIVDVEGNLSGDEMRVGGFDLIYKNNAMVGSINNPASNYSTMLGADIPAEPRTCASGARGKAAKRDGQKDDAAEKNWSSRFSYSRANVLTKRKPKATRMA